MRLPNLTQSADTLANELGVYHFARLNAEPSLDEMAVRWNAQQSRLRTRILDLQKAHEQALTALAARDGSAAGLAEGLRAFFGTLVTKTHNDRKSPIFKTYFPDGLTAILRGSLESQAQRAGVLVDKLAQETDKDLAAYLTPLTEALKALAETTGVYHAATEAEDQAFGRIEQEKFAWLDLYKLDHRTLMQKFYQDSKKADSYFKPARKARVKLAPATKAVALAPSQEATA